jgi:hypothetical protein
MKATGLASVRLQDVPHERSGQRTNTSGGNICLPLNRVKAKGIDKKGAH